MMQLREALDLIDMHFADLHRGYLAAIVKDDLFRFVIDGRKSGSITL